MINTKNIQIEKALQAFPLWNQVAIEQRAKYLNEAALSFSGDAQKMAQWQINNALEQIAAKQLMPGPTGESNQLSNQGRGVFVSQLDPLEASTEAAFTALVAQVFAALMAGNSVIHLGDLGKELISKLEEDLPEGVLQDAYQVEKKALLQDIRLAGVALISTDDKIIEMKQLLSNKEGLLCQLVTETDLESFSTQAKPSFIHQFTTEQTISTNTTAVGGNATLLELGSKTD